MLDEYLKKLQTFVKTYKWYFIPFGFAILFLLFIIVLFPTKSSKEKPSQTLTPTVRVDKINQSLSPMPTGTIQANDLIKKSETDGTEILSKTDLGNGITQYTFTSTDKNRPDILIIKDNNPIYQRTMSIPDYPVPLSYYSKYGEPDSVVVGSKYYGNTAETYIFAKRGITVIADPQNMLVYEVQLYPSITESEYIAIYGQDLIDKNNVVNKPLPTPEFEISEEND